MGGCFDYIVVVSSPNSNSYTSNTGGEYLVLVGEPKQQGFSSFSPIPISISFDHMRRDIRSRISLPT
ncbi:hypothetical protein ACLOJK_023779 [Asimina triloba]